MTLSKEQIEALEAQLETQKQNRDKRPTIYSDGLSVTLDNLTTLLQMAKASLDARAEVEGYRNALMKACGDDEDIVNEYLKGAS